MRDNVAKGPLVDTEEATLIKPGKHIDFPILFLAGSHYLGRLITTSSSAVNNLLNTTFHHVVLLLSHPRTRCFGANIRPIASFRSRFLFSFTQSVCKLVEHCPHTPSKLLCKQYTCASGWSDDPLRLGWRSELYDCCRSWNTELYLYFWGVCLYRCTSKVGCFGYNRNIRGPHSYVLSLFDVTCLYALTAGNFDPSFVNSMLPKMTFVALDYPNTDDLHVAIHHLFV